MKIVSVTMVNNESEIIESFVRYNANIFDTMVVVDNGCTDNTIKIIKRLSLEDGFDVILFDESLESYEQKKIENKYVDYAINQLDADIVIPLDADEFLIAERNPRDILQHIPMNKIYYIHWSWYVLTGNENFSENFIPKRLTYRLVKTPWEYATGKSVTKVILPSKYYREKKLRLSMGHHFVSGEKEFEVEYRNDLKLAHYRIISPEQVRYKSLCYSIRDISTMTLNDETAQRTSQVARLNKEKKLMDEAISESYCGYDSDIVNDPINLSFCKKETIMIKYAYLSKESIIGRITDVSREMAIKVYNLEFGHKSTKDKILFWLDGVSGESILFPTPSRTLERESKKYNTWGFVTDCNEVSFLKHDFRLIVPIKFAKFIPHVCVVVTDEENFLDIRNKLISEGLDYNEILSLNEYKLTMGIIKREFFEIRFLGKRGIRFTERFIRKVKFRILTTIRMVLLLQRL